MAPESAIRPPEIRQPTAPGAVAEAALLERAVASHGGWARGVLSVPRRLFFSASPGLLLAEAYLTGVLVALVLNLPTIILPGYFRLLTLNYLVVLAVGPLLALWCALRLRWVAHANGGGILREALRAAGLSMLLGVLPIGVLLITYLRLLRLPTGAVPVPQAVLRQPFGDRRAIALAVVFALGFVGEFLAARTALWGLRWWNGLRRRHLQWALTHAHLVLVVLAISFLALIMEGIQLLSSPSSALRSLIPVSVVFVIATIISIGLILPPSAIFSYLFARRTTKRLRSLAAATSALRAGDYSQRVAVEGEDEVAQVQENFNAMAQALQRSVRELEDERDRVASLLRSRRELVASVSHELRTPVATLRGYLESTSAHWDDAPPPTLKHDLAIMEGEVSRLQALIQDLFTLSRAEVGRLEMCREPTDVGVIARRVTETLAPIAWQVGRVQVTCAAATEVPLALVDASRLEQVLHNLVHNALQHTPPGGIIALDARPGATPGEDGMLLVAVRDTGEGIAPTALPHLFERFYRTEASRRSPESGSGLGLALVKELTEAMGGSVAVASVIGEGSCFTLRLPLAA